MSKFAFTNCGMNGLYIVQPTIYSDERGYFMESFQADEFAQAGLDSSFVQDNESYSYYGVLRGLHFQCNHPQGKLIRVLSGEIFDVAVDIRPDSHTFGKWFGTVLSSDNKTQLYMAAGFAHGFVTLSTVAQIAYKCTACYAPDDQWGILWSDKDININWPLDSVDICVNSRDASFGSLSQLAKCL